jgi:hypothetical protein
MLTLVDFEICDGLPFVHSHSPSITNFAAAQVNDQFAIVTVQSIKYRLQSLKRE